MQELDSIWKPTKYPNYEVSYTGQVRKLYKNRQPRILAQYHKKKKETLVVKISLGKGENYEVCVHKLVADAFVGKCPSDCVIYHKNGVITDNFAMNIGFINRRELGKKTGYMSNAKSVVVIDKTGTEIDYFKSARECARNYFCSYQTVIDRCNGTSGEKEIKKPFGDIDFAWEDSKVSIRRANKRLGVR